MEFLADSGGGSRSLIISASELTAREGMKLEKGMAGRPGYAEWPDIAEYSA